MTRIAAAVISVTIQIFRVARFSAKVFDGCKVGGCFVGFIKGPLSIGRGIVTITYNFLAYDLLKGLGLAGFKTVKI